MLYVEFKDLNEMLRVARVKRAGFLRVGPLLSKSGDREYSLLGLAITARQGNIRLFHKRVFKKHTHYDAGYVPDAFLLEVRTLRTYLRGLGYRCGFGSGMVCL